MKQIRSIVFVCLTGLVLACSAQVKSGAAIAIEIQKQLSVGTDLPALNYPRSVARLYAEGRFTPVWVNDTNGKDDKWQAMLLIDCVLQYGLSPADYHPKELTYDKLNSLSETPDKISIEEKARFDIVLTDAMITMINHLHYGKLNPNYSHDKLDQGLGLPFNAEKQLRYILLQADFKAGVLNVQPLSKTYADLQYEMRQLKGQYDGDCYTVPEETIRKIAINMERIRWAALDDNTAYVHINVPSFKLTYHLPDGDTEFKVIVGGALTPTPVLQSNISYFTTAPEWRMPNSIFTKELLPKAIKNPAYIAQNNYTIYNPSGSIENPDQQTLKNILKAPKGYYAKQSAGCDNALGLLVFRFNNIYSVYLHDTPDKTLFTRSRRDLSHGCIRIENPETFAELLLKNDGQQKQIAQLKKNILTEKRQNFTLNKPIPIKITYLTCTIIEGELITYPDIYAQDKVLEMALYNINEPKP